MKRNASLSSIFSLVLLAALTTGAPAPALAQIGAAQAGAAQADAAIRAAVQAMARTNKQAQLWKNTGKLVKKAKAARKAGDFAKASKLAKEAKVQAQLAYSQFFEGQARFTADRLHRTEGLTTAQRERLKAIDALLRRHEGYKAYEMAERIKAEVVKGHRVYRVRPGDTLGKIATREYGSAQYWREIYQRNRARISNPNVIHPGQELLIGSTLGD
jgi:nucleoid-associated protein YgaU